MSKAFTRESDDLPERPTTLRPFSSPPPGVKNYLTPDGARRLREELDRLLQSERPRLDASTTAEGAKARRGALDARLRQLEESLRTAEVVPPPAPPWDAVRFGATVTVRDRQGTEERYRIVGADEADFDGGSVSWLSPIARALLNARRGQQVRFRIPDGEAEFEIVDIAYE